ncbi:hypothetical protein SD72_03670 [Leucobacter komagatae]|uniref:Enoyl reductase (ER) domain-containing protein n=1 Tax=Leucobacter komagatae TaxID=55969 RepID=A0A0D0IUS6_9MICO|nr:hypothetical protein SD72_03670 [Leucobacter komagatae]
MRALTTTPPALARVAEVPVPRPTDGEVLVRVILSAVCPHDRPVMSGSYHDAGLITLPTVGLGWDVLGEVVSANGSRQFLVGDRVAGTVSSYDLPSRAIAEYVSLPADSLAHVPESVADEDAVVSLISGITAIQALEIFGDTRGRLLITAAAGNVGSFAIPVALGLGFAVTGQGRDTDREFIEGLGATFTASVHGEYDAVFDAAALGAELLGVLADGGTYVGVHPGGEPVAQRGIRVSAVDAKPSGSDIAEILDLIAVGRAQPRIIERVSMEESAQLLNGPAPRGARGRVIVTI